VGRLCAGTAFGAIVQRTHFCTMGAVADIVNMGDWTRMRMWLLAIGVAMIGFNGMVAAGWIEAADSVYADPAVLWLSNIVGGLIFGLGMVLASGCGSKTLVRMGGGNLKSLVVLLRAGRGRLRQHARGGGGGPRGHAGPRDPDAASRPGPAVAAGACHRRVAPQLALWLGGGLGLLLVAWVLRRPEGRAGDVLLAGLGLGAVIVGVWWVSGRLGFVPEHPVTLEESFLGTNSRRMESLSFVAPIAYTMDWLILFSDAATGRSRWASSPRWARSLGSAAVALAFGQLPLGGLRRHRGHRQPPGGRGADGRGWRHSHGLHRWPGPQRRQTLALGSFLALGGILAGAVIGVRYQAWRVERRL
jgi:uncharacterized protein